MKYRACRIRRPPVLKSRCCKLVSDQFWMARGRASRRRRLPTFIRDDPEQQADLIGPEPCFALLDPLLRGPALVVEADDSPVGPGERRDDEAHPRKQLAEVMFDLGGDSSRSVGRGAE